MKAIGHIKFTILWLSAAGLWVVCAHTQGANIKTRLVRSHAVYDDVAETLAQCSTGTVTLTVCDVNTEASASVSAETDMSVVTLEQTSTATVTLTVSPSAVVRTHTHTHTHSQVTCYDPSAMFMKWSLW